MNNDKEIQIAWTICHLIERLNDLIWDRYENEFLEQYLKNEQEKYWKGQPDKDPLGDMERKTLRKSSRAGTTTPSSRNPVTSVPNTPKTTNSFNRAEIEQIVVMERLHLYNRGIPCGPKAIRRQLDRNGVQPLPSLSTIKRILSSNGLTHRRTGHYP